MKKSFILLAIFAVLIWTGCASNRDLGFGKRQKQLEKMLATSPVFSKSFTGFILMDPRTNRILAAQDADKYFTPASNTKIFTFFTALQILGDSIPVFSQWRQGENLILAGGGDPSLLHPELPQYPRIWENVRWHQGPVYLSSANWQDTRFGPGWAWDDYPYGYQAERAPLPMYGNFSWWTKTAGRPVAKVLPQRFNSLLTPKPGLSETLQRREWDNSIEYNPQKWLGADINRVVPFLWSDTLAAQLLSDTLGRTVGVWPGKVPALPGKLWQAPLQETVFSKLMKESDNFIAEQLLLACAQKKWGRMSSESTIKYVQDTLFKDAPDPLIWVDGSGLSRYNMFTPRTVAAVLQKLHRMLPQDRLFDIFPAGGVSGTIKNWYGNPGGKPYVFAKTGSLANKHCLSGYIVPKSGQVLVFSFMHNNFAGSSTPLRQEMQGTLEWIKEHY